MILTSRLMIVYEADIFVYLPFSIFVFFIMFVAQFIYLFFQI